MNVQMRVYILRTFVTHLFLHIHQKEKIAVKIASVNGPLKSLMWLQTSRGRVFACIFQIFATLSIRIWFNPTGFDIL
jgi:hypothetical protein